MPGDERKGFDRGILYILIAVVYLALAWVIIDSLDWNPHTPNYAQYLVGASGAYVDGGVYGDRYFFVVADSGDANSAALVFTDPSGEVLDAYRLSPRPSAVMNTKNALFFLFVEGNRLQILAYREGRFLHTFAASTTWSLQPIYPTRVVDDPYGLAFARKDDIDAQGIIFVSIEDNVLDPLLRVYFCRGCEFTPLYALPNGELAASVRKAVTIFIPAQNGVRTIEVRSTPAILPTDVCGDVLVGVSEDRHLVWSKLESDRLYDANIPVESFPICRDDEIYFSSDGVLSAVTISPELNEVVSFFPAHLPSFPMPSLMTSPTLFWQEKIPATQRF